jgi:hypothetical protein
MSLVKYKAKDGLRYMGKAQVKGEVITKGGFNSKEKAMAWVSREKQRLMSSADFLGSQSLTQEDVRKDVSYNPETGVFIRVTNIKGQKAGDACGFVGDKGYRTISINGKLITAGRLAWLYMEGYLPEHQIDHINRKRDDNRWCNLRHVTPKCNCRNRSVRNINKSGVTGVFWNKAKEKWIAQINPSGKKKFLGQYAGFSDAVMARWQGEIDNGWPNCDSTSSAYIHLKERGLV